jgi:excisionase family DNA binding protein
MQAERREPSRLPDRSLLTIAEVAEYLRIKESTCRRYVDAGLIRVVRVGPVLLRVRPEEVTRFVRDLEVGDRW